MVKADFPKIDYDFWLTKYLWEEFSSMDRMITTMKNKNYIEDNINHDNITDEIKLKIETYIKNSCNNDLFQVFKLIQTWGGKSVGNYTLDIVKNWNTPIKVDENVTTSYFNNYKNFVEKILNNKDYSKDVSQMDNSDKINKAIDRLRNPIKLMNEEEQKKVIASLPKMRLINPREIAELGYFLTTDAGRVLHGAVLDASMGLGVNPGLLLK